MKYLLRRLLTAIPLLFFVSLVTFLLMHAAPGGPFDQSQGGRLDPTTLAQLERFYGLDRPVWEQYWVYIGNALRLDLGPSLTYRNRDVNDLLREHFPYSARLGMQALMLALVIGVTLGILGALYHRRWVESVILIVTTLGLAIPTFVLSLYLILLFGSTLHWVSIAPSLHEYQTQFRPWVLPTLALALPVASLLARHTHSSLLEVLHQDYVRTAQAKGLSHRAVMYHHVLRNALLSVWTLLGPITVGLVTGSVIVERMFLIPGVGTFFVEAVGSRDYSLIMGTTLLYATLIVLANLLIDLTYSVIDPRIRIG